MEAVAASNTVTHKEMNLVLITITFEIVLFKVGLEGTILLHTGAYEQVATPVCGLLARADSRRQTALIHTWLQPGGLAPLRIGKPFKRFHFENRVRDTWLKPRVNDRHSQVN